MTTLGGHSIGLWSVLRMDRFRKLLRYAGNRLSLFLETQKTCFILLIVMDRRKFSNTPAAWPKNPVERVVV